MKTSGCVVVFLLVFIVCSVKADLKVMPLRAIQEHGGIKLRIGERKLLRNDPSSVPSAPAGNTDKNNTG